MSPLQRFARTFAGAATALALASAFGSTTDAQEQPVLLLIDRDSIAHTQLPNAFTTQDVNDELAAVGMRDGLPVFRRSLGQPLTLRTGQGDNPGWHALVSVPASWKSAEDENDGLSNFVLAGPGLGSADESGDRTKFLRDAGIASLSGSAVASLQGRSVCAVVYQGDLIAAAANADLAGATLGLAAFRVSAVHNADGAPTVDVEPLDTQDVCTSDLVLPAAPPSAQ